MFSDFTRFYILLLLHEETGEHGYKIMQMLNERLGHKVSPSLVYPFLRLLEQDGYVRVIAEHAGQKKKNIYNLTPNGRALCRDLFKQFTVIVSSAIEPSMHTCAHCGCKVYKEAHIEKIKGRSVNFCCRYCASAYRRAKRG